MDLKDGQTSTRQQIGITQYKAPGAVQGRLHRVKNTLVLHRTPS